MPVHPQRRVPRYKVEISKFLAGASLDVPLSMEPNLRDACEKLVTAPRVRYNRRCMAKVLVIDDDLAVCQVIEDWLESQQHIVEIVNSGCEAESFLSTYQYDVIILDWMLPDANGPDILKKFRTSGGQTPVLMLTGRGQTHEKEHGLDAGADDYLTKPFDTRELAARVRALLRRAPAVSNVLLTAHHVTLSTVSREVKSNGKTVKLYPREFVLLEFLMRHQGQVFSADTLLDRLWKADAEVGPETIRTCVKRLRQVLDVPGQESVVETVHGVGYKLRGA